MVLAVFLLVAKASVEAWSSTTILRVSDFRLFKHSTIMQFAMMAQFLQDCHLYTASCGTASAVISCSS